MDPLRGFGAQLGAQLGVLHGFAVTTGPVGDHRLESAGPDLEAVMPGVVRADVGGAGLRHRGLWLPDVV
ncbi:hypothetical protein [Frankia sp. Cas4]|uniref:hypothetical protein n=1 Tax=Frankia sp. Cas4 TaxID=3073927 RepID=UPI002AD32EBB|nr:hypothetical protein [Frankia sp. Cas4]